MPDSLKEPAIAWNDVLFPMLQGGDNPMQRKLQLHGRRTEVFPQTSALFPFSDRPLDCCVASILVIGARHQIPELTKPAIFLSPRELCGQLFFEAFHAEVATKCVSDVMIAHESELALAVMAYFQ
jgi:hypothetical protein